MLKVLPTRAYKINVIKERFVFNKLPNFGVQQIIFDFLDLNELISLRVLNKAFLSLLRSGAVPSKIRIGEQMQFRSMIKLLNRPLTHEYVT